MESNVFFKQKIVAQFNFSLKRLKTPVLKHKLIFYEISLIQPMVWASAIFGMIQPSPIAMMPVETEGWWGLPTKDVAILVVTATGRRMYPTHIL